MMSGIVKSMAGGKQMAVSGYNFILASGAILNSKEFPIYVF